MNGSTGPLDSWTAAGTPRCGGRVKPPAGPGPLPVGCNACRGGRPSIAAAAAGQLQAAAFHSGAVLQLNAVVHVSTARDLYRDR